MCTCINVVPGRLDFGAGLLGGLNPLPLTIESCGLEPLRVDAIRIESGTDAFAMDEENLPVLPLRLPAADLASDQAELPSENLVVHFTPEEEIAYGGTLFIESRPICPRGRSAPNGAAARTNVRRPVSHRKSFLLRRWTSSPLMVRLNGCRRARRPADTLRVDYIKDQQGQRRCRWRALLTQFGRKTVVHPMTARAQALFFVDIAGEYLLELTVTDRLGAMAPAVQPQPGSRIRIVAEPLADVHIQLLWVTPGDRCRRHGRRRGFTFGTSCSHGMVRSHL